MSVTILCLCDIAFPLYELDDSGTRIIFSYAQPYIILYLGDQLAIL